MEILKMDVYGKETEIILPVKYLVGTMYVGSDRYCVVCTSVTSNKRCKIVVLHNINESNYKNFIEKDKDNLEYLKQEFYDNMVDESNSIKYSLRKNGVWYPVGNEMRPGCSGITFGYGRPYIDPSF